MICLCDLRSLWRLGNRAAGADVYELFTLAVLKALRDYVLRSAYIHIHNLLIKFRRHAYYSGGVDYDRLRAFGDRKQPVERCGVTYIPFHDFCA